jgi:hypothetical protein
MNAEETEIIQAVRILHVRPASEKMQASAAPKKLTGKELEEELEGLLKVNKALKDELAKAKSPEAIKAKRQDFSHLSGLARATAAHQADRR